MIVDGKPFRTIWLKKGQPETVQIIDQRALPHRFTIEDIGTTAAMATAIRDMHVRGAGLIGASAGFGMYLAALEAAVEPDCDLYLKNAYNRLIETRPTAVNLKWALDRQMKAIQAVESVHGKITTARETAQAIADEDAEHCREIGRHGSELIREISKRKGGSTVNILTHCNAGWLAFVDYGSATAPIYAAHAAGIPVHVYVDETRPRNQGAALTAWELGQQGIPHTVIVDNAGGHLMQHGKVDLVITGTDRTTFTGDVVNKIGTYLKALAARDNGVPFYVALPSSTFDWELEDGIRGTAIEERNPREVTHIEGWSDGEVRTVRITPEGSPASNFAFDVTPARLISGLITERGICPASREGIMALYSELPEDQEVHRE